MKPEIRNDERQPALSTLDKAVLSRYQKNFPRTSRPFLTIANELGCSEQEVLNCFQRLKQEGVISRVGPVFNHKKAGASTLAAIAVPNEHLERTAALINGFQEVNHNYQREHELNLWFVVTASDQDHLTTVIGNIEAATEMKVWCFPMVRPYHIDLGFRPEFD
ncbi:AsnC family protein [Hahella sp. CCB-MM4]|uniref:Lrp/AsnC family transcriptional regulator n=1 Tax=Hahella sp. (strain CCB-MM4) TaxID=1926491 RepID=UPI000B9B404D|nr:Lrp/AsnC family transcriptional regulator [Hahella sp. CCB-MM4]OZG72974.1 AsnC family protein [Hahella sp. CCB-MM4]